MNETLETIDVVEISWEEFLASGTVISEDDSFKPTKPAEFEPITYTEQKDTSL